MMKNQLVSQTALRQYALVEHDTTLTPQELARITSLINRQADAMIATANAQQAVQETLYPFQVTSWSMMSGARRRPFAKVSKTGGQVSGVFRLDDGRLAVCQCRSDIGAKKMMIVFDEKMWSASIDKSPEQLHLANVKGYLKLIAIHADRPGSFRWLGTGQKIRDCLTPTRSAQLKTYYRLNAQGALPFEVVDRNEAQVAKNVISGGDLACVVMLLGLTKNSTNNEIFLRNTVEIGPAGVNGFFVGTPHIKIIFSGSN